MKRFTNEVKVGIFFILCLLGLLYLTLSTGKFHLKEQGYNIYVKFKDVSGLQKDSPVMVNGLEVGRVQDIKVSYSKEKAEIILKLLINKGIKIWENPNISIKTLGLMGEKYIQIASHKGKDFIKPGAILKGSPSLDMDALMEKAEGMSKDVTKLLDNVNSLTDEVKKLTQNLNCTVEKNQDTITKIIKNLEVTSKNVEELTEDLKRHPWKILYKTKEKKEK